jgi:hypothetical protein
MGFTPERKELLVRRIAVVLLMVAALEVRFGSRLATAAEELPGLIVQPDLFATLVNPPCSHCRDEAIRRGDELRPDEPVLCWIRGKYEGGAIPLRFFLVPYRVISDTYGVFVYDADAGFLRGFEPSLDFEFHGFYRGVMVVRDKKDGTLYSALSGRGLAGPGKGKVLKPVATMPARWGYWLKLYPDTVAYHMYSKYTPIELPSVASPASVKSRINGDARLRENALVVGLAVGEHAKAYPIEVSPTAVRLIHDRFADQDVVVLWFGPTQTAAMFAARTDDPDSRKLSLKVDDSDRSAPLVDRETGSRWDIAGRARSGPLKGKTLVWLPGVACRWFAWAAEFPGTQIHEKEPTVADVP